MYHCVKGLQQMLNVFYLFISMTVKMVPAHYEKLLTVLSTGLKKYLPCFLYLNKIPFDILGGFMFVCNTKHLVWTHSGILVTK